MSLDMAGDEGDYLFEQIEKDHSVQVILEKDTEEKRMEFSLYRHLYWVMQTLLLQQEIMLLKREKIIL